MNKAIPWLGIKFTSVSAAFCGHHIVWKDTQA